MTQRFGKHNDKTVAQLLKEDPAYIVWLYEQPGGPMIVSLEDYGSAIEELSQREPDPIEMMEPFLERYGLTVERED